MKSVAYEFLLIRGDRYNSLRSHPKAGISIS